MAQVTLSTKNQIVVPREAREALGIRPGQKIMVVVRGNAVILMPKPDSHQSAIRGLSRGAFSSDHLERERQSWD